MSARARQKAGIKGVSALRKSLRDAAKIDGALTKEIVETIEGFATETEQVMRYMAPRDEGDMMMSITHISSTDGLSTVIGPGIRGVTTVKKRAGSVGATVGIQGGQAVDIQTSTGKRLNFSARTQFDRFQMMKAYWLEVGTKKMGRHPFVRPTFDVVKDKASKGIRDAVNRGLNKIFTRKAA